MPKPEVDKQQNESSFIGEVSGMKITHPLAEVKNVGYATPDPISFWKQVVSDLPYRVRLMFPFVSLTGLFVYYRGLNRQQKDTQARGRKVVKLEYTPSSSTPPKQS